MDSLLLRASTTPLTLRLAETPSEVAAAQRLRYRVFTEEFGATLRTPMPNHDVDAFDGLCDHLIVVDDASDAVVATYRLLPPGRSDIRYADSGFDLTTLAPIGEQLVETGRSCVDPAYRDGAAINLLWAGIARYMHLRQMRYLGGCASIPLDDGGLTASGFRALALAKHLAPEGWQVTPRRPWVGPSYEADRPRVPALLRGYLRLGAWIGGEPGYDPDFDCADFYVLLDVERIHPRYMTHFLGDLP